MKIAFFDTHNFEKEAIYNITYTTINNIVDYNSEMCANELGGK